MQEDILAHEHRMDPTLLVMPWGTFYWRTDNEWVDGTHNASAWETYVARDVVKGVDQRFRTIANGDARAIGGVSEGGYAALNIAIHHPGEFRVVEGFLPYTLADRTQSQVFGGQQRRIRYNSPLLTVGQASDPLRRAQTFFWMLMASKDPLRRQTFDFAAELQRLHILHQLIVGIGTHQWAFIRPYVRTALITMSEHLSHESA